MGFIMLWSWYLMRFFLPLEYLKGLSFPSFERLELSSYFSYGLMRHELYAGLTQLCDKSKIRCFSRFFRLSITHEPDGDVMSRVVHY